MSDELMKWCEEIIIEPIAQRSEWRDHPQVERMKAFASYLCYKEARVHGIVTLAQRAASNVTSIDRLTRIVEDGFSDFSKKDPRSRMP